MSVNCTFICFSDGPSVTLTKSEDSRTEVKMSCIVDSNPPSKVIWLKDGVEIVPNNSFMMSEQRNKYVLRLAELDYKAFGNYSCVAQNKLGKDEAMTKIAGMYVKHVVKYFHLG